MNSALEIAKNMIKNNEASFRELVFGDGAAMSAGAITPDSNLTLDKLVAVKKELDEKFSMPISLRGLNPGYMILDDPFENDHGISKIRMAEWYNTVLVPTYPATIVEVFTGEPVKENRIKKLMRVILEVNPLQGIRGKWIQLKHGDIEEPNKVKRLIKLIKEVTQDGSR